MRSIRVITLFNQMAVLDCRSAPMTSTMLLCGFRKHSLTQTIDTLFPFLKFIFYLLETSKVYCTQVLYNSGKSYKQICLLFLHSGASRSAGSRFSSLQYALVARSLDKTSTVLQYSHEYESRVLKKYYSTVLEH